MYSQSQPCPVHFSYTQASICEIIVFVGFFKTQLICRVANIHPVCMLVPQFKNIKRSVPAIQHMNVFPSRLPHRPGIIIPGHNQQRWLTRTNCKSQLWPQGIYNGNANVMRILTRRNQPFNQSVLNISGSKEILTKNISFNTSPLDVNLIYDW